MVYDRNFTEPSCGSIVEKKSPIYVNLHKILLFKYFRAQVAEVQSQFIHNPRILRDNSSTVVATMTVKRRSVVLYTLENEC